MLGRTYSIGYEPDLEDTLFTKPRSKLLSPANRWAVWYPLQRSKKFQTLPADHQRRILAEHGSLAKRYGAGGHAADVRLACHGLDKNDNDFIVGLLGPNLHPLSAVVQEMRKTEQTAQYLDSLGPFFVGKAVVAGEAVTTRPRLRRAARRIVRRPRRPRRRRLVPRQRLPRLARAARDESADREALRARRRREPDQRPHARVHQGAAARARRARPRAADLLGQPQLAPAARGHRRADGARRRAPRARVRHEHVQLLQRLPPLSRGSVRSRERRARRAALRQAARAVQPPRRSSKR